MGDLYDINALTGLSEEEAAERLRKEGHNELPSSRQRGFFAIAFEVVREPMFLLLVAGGVIYVLLGDIREAVMLLGFVFVVMGITLYQERKTERALEALRDLSSPRALVIRGGEQVRIPGREVVRGDTIILAEGDRVPADAALISCVNLSIDESLLTGESVPVRKTACDDSDEMKSPGGDDLPFVYSGTLVVQGTGIGRVMSTGAETELGRIGKALEKIGTEETLLQKETGRVVRNLAIAGLSLCALIVVVYGQTRGDWLNGLLAGITLAMAILPEEFPVVLTIFLALGAWRISRRRVLTRRVPAVEMLGSTSVLCVDKTGTLTMNKMKVSTVFCNGSLYNLDEMSGPLPEDLHGIIEFSLLASHQDPFDPMEKALRDLGKRSLAGTEHLHDNWAMIQEYPLSGHLLSMSRVWKSTESGRYVIAAKGAPEAIADLCHLDKQRTSKLSQHANSMASQGLRVIGIARADFEEQPLPGEQHDFPFEFLGLIGMSDPVRPGVPSAIEECKNAGIRVVMITGDYPATARNIAARIGLAGAEEILTGPDLDAMDDKKLHMKIKTVNIFARVIPEQKLRIVDALKAESEIVAMTGDGVNDAPALKSAHIGIAMGGRGTDVAREASSIVLLDDDFTSIVGAVRTGRRIFENMKKAMTYILAVHVPIAGMSLLPVLFNWPLVLLPVHILFLELIIDPACSVVFEAEEEEPDIMARPPRDPARPLFSFRTVLYSIIQGLSVLLVVFAVFGISMYRGQDELDARALSFTTLIISNLGLIFTNRSRSLTLMETLRKPNSALWLITLGAIFFLGIVLYVPVAKDLFRFSTLHFTDLAICLSAGIFSVIWIEGLKVYRRINRF